MIDAPEIGLIFDEVSDPFSLFLHLINEFDLVGAQLSERSQSNCNRRLMLNLGNIERTKA